MVAHELRTPIGRIMANAELIEILSIDERVGKAAKDILRAASSMASRLSALASYSQASFAHPREDVELRKSVQSIVDSLGVADRIQLTIDEGLPAVLRLESVVFEQILENLISNAAKYAPTGAISVDLHKTPNNHLAIQVSDVGLGIAQEDLERIWEPYYRRQHAAVPGRGLGLAFVKLAARQMGGTVQVHSRLGFGATFTIKLPLSE